MFSADNLSSLVRNVIASLSGQNGGSNGSTNSYSSGNGASGDTSGSNTGAGLSVTPAQALIIVGLLAGVFEVTSVLVDKNQLVEIVLSGSLREKTPSDKLLEQVATMSVDDLFKALFQRYT